MLFGENENWVPMGEEGGGGAPWIRQFYPKLMFALKNQSIFTVSTFFSVRTHCTPSNVLAGDRKINIHGTKINRHTNKNWLGFYEMPHERNTNSCTNANFSTKYLHRSTAWKSESVHKNSGSGSPKLKGRTILNVTGSNMKTRSDTKKKVRFSVNIVEDFQETDQGILKYSTNVNTFRFELLLGQEEQK